MDAFIVLDKAYIPLYDSFNMTPDKYEKLITTLGYFMTVKPFIITLFGVKRPQIKRLNENENLDSNKKQANIILNKLLGYRGYEVNSTKKMKEGVRNRVHTVAENPFFTSMISVFPSEGKFSLLKTEI
jgi:hypothetical protein